MNKNSNEFYIPLRKNNLIDGFQEIYTDNELKYYTDTNTLSTGSIVGNFIGSSYLATNMNKPEANNQLLYQVNNNTTSLLPNPNTSGQYLSYGGINNPPYWSSTIPFPELRYFFTIFGNPIDGSQIINQNYSLPSDMYYETLTINAPLNTNGFKLFVNGTLTINSNISVTENMNGSLEFVRPEVKNSTRALLASPNFDGGNGGKITTTFTGNTKGLASLIQNVEQINLFPNFINMKIGPDFITAGAAGGNGQKSTISQLEGGLGGTGGGILFICAREIIVKDSTIRLNARGGNGENGKINPNNNLDYSAPGGGGGGGLIMIITRSIKFSNGSDITSTSNIFNVSGGSPGSTQGSLSSLATSGNSGLVRIILV
jgi:hypothetical protein